jgi:hypothetical protein
MSVPLLVHVFVPSQLLQVNNPALSDVRFRFPHEGDKILYAHRNILALRCAPFQVLFLHCDDPCAFSIPVLLWLWLLNGSLSQAMLRVPMKEAREGEIVIEDKKYRTFYILLEVRAYVMCCISYL